MAEGFGQWRAMDLASGQSRALAWVGIKEIAAVLVEEEKKENKWL